LMHRLYRMYSQTINKFYVGESTNAKSRLANHNSHKFKKKIEQSASDWELKLDFWGVSTIGWRASIDGEIHLKI